jgi:hypothetical protein
LSRFPARLAAALVAALAISAPVAAHASASAPPPAGSIGVRLLDAPVSAADDPRAQLYIVDHLAPGAVITRRVEVSNATVSTARIALYSSAATIVNGLFVGAARGTANDLSTWTAVTPDIANVAAGGRSIAMVTIAVPADAAPGEQYGVVWAEVRSAPSAGGGLTEVSRVGIRLYVSVGPGGPPPAEFTIDSLTARRSPAGVPSIVADVHNTGGRALDLGGSVQLTGGPGGLNAGPFPIDLGVTLAIGATEPITVVFDQALPSGPWQVVITLHSGLVERSARASIVFPEIGAGAPVKTTGSSRNRWSLMTPFGVAAVLIASTLVVRRRRRVRRFARQASAGRQPWGPPSAAAQVAVSWRL